MSRPVKSVADIKAAAAVFCKRYSPLPIISHRSPSQLFSFICTTELVSANRRQGGSSQSLIDRTCWSGRQVPDQSPSGLVIWALYCASSLFPPTFALALHSVASSDDSRLSLHPEFCVIIRAIPSHEIGSALRIVPFAGNSPVWKYFQITLCIRLGC
jgi:hypothetical protein